MWSLFGDPTIRMTWDDIHTGCPEVAVSEQTPALRLSSPNPFSERTSFQYSVGTPSRVTLRVYDVAGRLVRTIVDRHHVPGKYERSWDGRNEHGVAVASGVYFCRMRALGFEQEQAIVLLR